MKQYRWLVALLVGAFLLAACESMQSAVPTPEVELASGNGFVYTWDGIKGLDSEDCELDRDDDGWIHWVFATKGRSTSATLTLSGTGEGTYSAGQPLRAAVWHFYTPFFELEGLDASVTLNRAAGPGVGLVISDWCGGDDRTLKVTKTAETSFTREHFWDIDKFVTTVDGATVEVDGEDVPKIWLFIDGSGNEKATWTVDVEYLGAEDRDFVVSGVITIENIGTTDKLITGVFDDLIGGFDPENEQLLIDVDCPVAEFPFLLEAGETLECTYSQVLPNAKVGDSGTNTAKVTVEGEEPYFGQKDWEFTEPPTLEINKTVNVKDISDLFGEVALGSVTAPNGDRFTYPKDFAWEDYGADGCGSFTYDNTATIVETEQSASATLKVNVQCFVDETAHAKGDPNVPFCDTFPRWGWTNPITPSTYEWPLWAGAAQCDTSKGTLVGSVTVVYDAAGVVAVTYNVALPYLLRETHVYVGYDPYPPGQLAAVGLYENYGPFDGSQVYVIAHGVVGVPDPDFGP